jgi:hypothetical protein
VFVLSRSAELDRIFNRSIDTGCCGAPLSSCLSQVRLWTLNRSSRQSHRPRELSWPAFPKTGPCEGSKYPYASTLIPSEQTSIAIRLNAQLTPSRNAMALNAALAAVYIFIGSFRGLLSFKGNYHTVRRLLKISQYP